MSKNLYVGNLPWSATEEDIRAAFEAYGEVTSVKLIEDRETGRPRGFGFVEMSDDNGALEAIDAMDGKDFGGRNLKVNEAKPRAERPRW
ncbi:RNA recognition motif domain-containing protein [Pseudodesulfovibrio sp.]|uniref:RNA recognition motif domain-containing protein n=1 Tax=unclassified Pseudodesulfovibrio TaxID=2661612 RepID=UPI003B003CD4